MLELTAIGIMGKKPELKHGKESGKEYVRFSLSCRQKFKEHNIWIECTAFGKAAEIICQYTDKGSRLFVRGDAKSSHYTHKDSGELVDKLELLVADFEICQGKPKGEGEHSEKKAPPKSSGPTTHHYEEDDDVPF